jgi:DNA-binding winged helix-turn-helix (wHTH) protein/TolB-like protein
VENTPTKLFFEFGEFRLDPEKHRLLRDGEIVGLTPKAVETLCVLVQRHGKLVERGDLMSSVWTDVAVEDGNLTVTVSMLRKALGEYGNGRKFIETVPRLGYKFVADVRQVFEEVPTLIVEKQTSGRIVIDEQITFGRKTLEGSGLPLLSLHPQRRTLLFAAGALLILAVGLFAYFGPWKSNHPTAVANINSIAVLPFKTIDSQNGNSHQGLGLADLLITRLSNVNKIKVRPTSSVMSFENTQEDSISIARKLQVDAILEGTFYRAGDRVRITGRLINVNDQSIIWSGQFERLVKDEFQLQNEIALQVVAALALNLNGNEKSALTKRYTESADAYELYLKGRYEWNKRNYGGLSEAQRLFRNAIEKDPNFALAYVGLADSMIFSEDAVSIGAALRKALELDPNLAEAYATQGFNFTVHHWLWKDAETSFRKSIELNPNYATSHHWYAILLGIQGRTDEAKVEMGHALEIDPGSYNFLADLGQLFYFNHEYDQAKNRCWRALEIYSDFTYAHIYLSDIYLQTGEYEAAIDELIKGQDTLYHVLNESSEQERLTALNKLKEPYRQAGIRRFMEARVHASENTSHTGDASARYGQARIYAFLGDKPKALDRLERALEDRAFMMAWVKADPIFDNLHSEQRYQSILKRMGLA